MLSYFSAYVFFICMFLYIDGSRSEQLFQQLSISKWQFLNRNFNFAQLRNDQYIKWKSYKHYCHLHSRSSVQMRVLPNLIFQEYISFASLMSVSMHSFIHIYVLRKNQSNYQMIYQTNKWWFRLYRIWDLHYLPKNWILPMILSGKTLIANSSETEESWLRRIVWWSMSWKRNTNSNKWNRQRIDL